LVNWVRFILHFGYFITFYDVISIDNKASEYNLNEDNYSNDAAHFIDINNNIRTEEMMDGITWMSEKATKEFKALTLSIDNKASEYQLNDDNYSNDAAHIEDINNIRTEEMMDGT
jgi:hypothetical protein